MRGVERATDGEVDLVPGVPPAERAAAQVEVQPAPVEPPGDEPPGLLARQVHGERDQEPGLQPGAGPESRDEARAKARVYLLTHEDHVAVQKLRRNRQLTPGDLGELERLLLEAGVADQQDLDRATQEAASGLGLFVWSLVGLDREAATAAFENFLAGKALSANQLHFVSLVIAGLTESGVLEPGRLYESPFTDVAPQGPDAMFASADIESLLDILVEVKAHAIPAAEMGSAS